MKKVLVATVKPFASEAIDHMRDVVEAAGYELRLLEKYSDKAELLAAVADVHALIVRSDQCDAEVLNAASELEIVVRAGAGYDNVDIDAASKKGIVVMNTPGQNSNAVAELTFGLLLHLVRNGFNGTAGTELFGKTFGIMGYGNIGMHLARIAKGFDMDVMGCSPTLDEELAAEAGIRYADGPTVLFSSSRIISLNIPSNHDTRGIINRELMMMMPKCPILVNTARKEIINEADLEKVLEEREDFRYAADVAPNNREILEKRFPGRVVFTTKKMGAQTAEANINAGTAAASQIVAFFQKGDTTFQVN
ncbi:D-3-phosphoglycerate dehydrogenase [Prolixibacter bellariivorans]|uniref:D-3-phosphoglycerate dehydrogenase n=1 Tax=Prolixibacter bellariivorans TaxID=314319 RepID=A0A5M4AUZ2_9BACT|nr:NAD(P)-dependent oxidoreductase [Prolixibacter bellariivorans]GET31762.1 D-3-phosphoglycerate dehydrogenase [Prolixibacter bellariivorans]